MNGKKKRKNPLHNCRLISDVKYMLNPKYFVGMDGFFRNSDHNMKVTHKQILGNFLNYAFLRFFCAY